MTSVKEVNQSNFETVKKEQSRKNPNSIKSQLFAKFDEIKPNEGALEINLADDDNPNYIQSLASQYNRQEDRTDIKLRTMKTADESKIYIYAVDA